MLDALWLASGDWTLDLAGASPEPGPVPVPQPDPDDDDGQTATFESEQQGGSRPDHPIGEKRSEELNLKGYDEQDSVEDDNFGKTAYSPVQVELGEPTVAASAIGLPAARTLADRLPLTRAPRPLRQPFPSQRTAELDEEATAELTAELRSAGLTGVFPVERPARERWFDVHVVLEDDPAAALWEAPLEEFARVLAQSGAFRLVRTWRLQLDPAAPQDPARASLALLRRSAEDTSNRQNRRAQARISGHPRELILFASHGASAHWLDGSYARLLLGWSGAAVALVHLLPGDRQAQTALGEPHGVCLAPQAGASAAALRAEVMWWRTDVDPESPRAVRLPMATLEPVALGMWALTEMARGRRAPLYLLDANAAIDARGAKPDALTALDVEQRLAGIRERSAAAYELAIALSVGPFTLPVARVVQEVLFGSATDTILLADLLLSGIVAMDPSSGVGDATFRVVDHARSALAQASRADDRARLVEELQQRVGRQLGEKAAEALSFTALMRDAAGHERLSASIAPFASFVRPIVEGLAAPPEPPFNVERFIETCPPTGLGELYRLSIRHEELSERTVRPQLWRVLRQSYLIVFDNDRWIIRPELADALRKATNGDPMWGLRILWVDDRPANNRSVIRTLNARTVFVVEAKSTEEAMARSDLGGYDLIISDMSRPPNHEAGFELIAALRDRGFQAPVIIAANVFARAPENHAKVLDAGGFGLTNDADQLLELIEDAAFVLLRIPAIRAASPVRSLDDVRRGVLAQIAVRYRGDAIGQPAAANADLNTERARLASLIRYRSSIPPPLPESLIDDALDRAASRNRQPPQREQGQQQPQQRKQMQQSHAQEDLPISPPAPLRFLVGKRVTRETRADVERHLQLFVLAADRAMSKPRAASSFRDTDPKFTPRLWHEALGNLPSNTGWTVEQTVTTRGLIEDDNARHGLRQMLGAAGANSREIAKVLNIVDDWQQGTVRANTEVPDWLASAADYAAETLHLWLAILLSGDQGRGEVRLLIFSSFITRIQRRNVFVLRFTPKIDADSLVMLLHIPPHMLLELGSSADDRLDAMPPSLLPPIEFEQLGS